MFFYRGLRAFLDIGACSEVGPTPEISSFEELGTQRALVYLKTPTDTEGPETRFSA